MQRLQLQGFNFKLSEDLCQAKEIGVQLGCTSRSPLSDQQTDADRVGALQSACVTAGAGCG